MKIVGSLLVSVALVTAATTCPNVKRETPSPALSDSDRKEHEVSEAVCTLLPTVINPHQDLTGDFVFAAVATNNYDALEFKTQYTMAYDIVGISNGLHTYHVHNVGDLWDTKGDSTELHFIGTSETRAEIGLVQDNPMQTQQQRESTGDYTDAENELTLNFGVKGNSILGRAMVVHNVGAEDGDPLDRAAQCVIGITGVKSGDRIIGMLPNNAAMATIFPTAPNNKKDSSKDYTKVTGWVQTVLNSENNLDVTGLLYGLPKGDYHVHINELGKYSTKSPLTDKGEASGETFQGVVEAARGQAGYIHGKGSGHSGSAGDYTIESDGLTAVVAFAFEDKYIKLNGENNIIGRMLVILEKGAGAMAKELTVGQGVIGVIDRRLESTFKTTVRPQDADVNEPPASPLVTRATTTIKGDKASTVGGYVTFDQLPTTDPMGPGVRIRYSIFGLPVKEKINWHVHVLGNGDATTAPGSSHFIGKGVARRNPALVGKCAQDTKDKCNATKGCSWVRLSGDSDVSECFNYLEQEAGLLGDRRAIMTDAHGVAKGVLFDAWISLNEWNSIIGRSLVIHDTNGITIGWGVVGRVAENSQFTARGGQKVTEAVCNFPSGGSASLKQAGPDVTISNLVGNSETLNKQVAVNTWGEIMYPRYSGNKISNSQQVESPCEDLTGQAKSITVPGMNLNNMLGRSLAISDGTERTSHGCVIGIKSEEPLTYNIYPPPEPTTPAPPVPPLGITTEDPITSTASKAAVFSAAAVATLFL